MLLHLLRLLPRAWTYQCTYFEMNASWRGTATLSSGRASATKSEIFPSYFHMRRHDEWRPCVWRLCASAAWQTNRNKKKKRNNNKYVGTRNTVFVHAYVCMCMSYAHSEDVEGKGVRNERFRCRRKNVAPTDREYGGRALRLHENEEKNLFRPYEKRRVSGMIYATRARESATRNFAFSAGSFVIVWQRIFTWVVGYCIATTNSVAISSPVQIFLLTFAKAVPSNLVACPSSFSSIVDNLTYIKTWWSNEKHVTKYSFGVDTL